MEGCGDECFEEGWRKGLLEGLCAVFPKGISS